MPKADKKGGWFGKPLLFLALIAFGEACIADSPAVNPDLSGAWVLNRKLSDDPDREIERAIRDVGGRPDADGKRGRGRYKGGPREQEIYDHLIYDETLRIAENGAEIRMIYAEGFERQFFTDGRSRTVSASGSSSGDAQDFSFSAWVGQTLNVEAKPRDGGWTQESYTLDPVTKQLRVLLKLKPLLFPAVVEVELVYERAAAAK